MVSYRTAIIHVICLLFLSCDILGNVLRGLQIVTFKFTAIIQYNNTNYHEQRSDDGQVMH